MPAEPKQLYAIYAVVAGGSCNHPTTESTTEPATSHTQKQIESPLGVASLSKLFELNVLTRKDSFCFPFYQVRAAQFISWHKVFFLCCCFPSCTFVASCWAKSRTVKHATAHQISFLYCSFWPAKVLLRQQEGNAFQMLTK